MKVYLVGTTDGFCEHCGDLEEGDKFYSDGGTHWCEICVECEGAEIVSKEEI
jgi:hypothetical protein